VIKADTLGSLEALIKLLKEKEITIKKASIGNITKKDIADAEANYEKDPLMTVILGFNVKSEIKESNAKIIVNDVIYKLIEDFESWQTGERKRLEAKQIDLLIRPAKLQIMKGYVFRQSNPAVCGVDILAGSLKLGVPLMKADGKDLTEVKAMQKDQKNVEKAEKNEQVAISMGGVTIGRQLNEGDTLWVGVPEADFRKLKEFKKYLSKEEIEILKEISEIKRKDNPVWGV
jgi:translation initiation factor 5B